MEHDIESTDSLLSYHEKVTGTFQGPKPHVSSLKSILHYLLCFFAGCVPAFGVLLFYGTHNAADPSIYKSPVPKMSQEVRMFEWDYVFTGLPSKESNSAWNSILPFGRGYIFLDEPAKYSLPAGELTPNGQIYSVALYHQLHCLAIIRRDYFALLTGVLENATDLRATVDDQVQNSHNRHCMDYLRQTLECHGDMTIEWERTEKDGSRHQVDGMHIPHQCVTKTEVTAFMQEQKGIVEMERKRMKDLKGV